MSDQNTALSIPTNLTAEVGIDKSDLVAVQVAQIETELIGQQHETEAELRKLKKELAEVKKTKKAEVNALAEAVDTTEAVAAMKALGFSVTAKATAKLEEGTITVRVDITQGSGYNRSCLSSDKTVKIPKSVKKAQERIAQLTEEIEETQVNLIDLRKKLSQIGTVERQAKANCALAWRSTVPI